MAFMDEISKAFSEGIMGSEYDPDKTILGMNPASLAVLGGGLGKAIAGEDTIAGRIGDIGVDLGRSRKAADAATEGRDFWTKLLASSLSAPDQLGATSLKAGADGKYSMDFTIPGSEEAAAGIEGVKAPTESGVPATTPTEATSSELDDRFKDTLGGQFSGF